MILVHLLQELRVFAAIAAVFGGLPWFLAKADPRRASWLVWSVRTVLFAETIGLALGRWRLCLPGAVISGLFLFAAGNPLLIGSGRISDWRTRLGSVLRMANPAKTLYKFEVGSKAGNFVAFLGRRRYRKVWIAALAFVVISPLRHVRFIDGRTYSRAVSLHVLSLGQEWTPDGSVAFLSPIPVISGEDAAAVIRCSNPVLIIALTAASWFTVWEWTFSAWGALAVGASAFVIAAFLRGGAELGSGGTAAIAWLVAIALLRRRSWDAAGAAALALMIEPAVHLEGLLYVSGSICGILVLAITPIRQLAPWTAAIPALVLALFQAPARPSPSQYESAATVAETIARTLPERHWLIVSPMQELAFTYGHGWHYELSEFVGEYPAERVTHPDFHFDFPVNTVFVFVEKSPLGEPSARDSALFNTVLEPAALSYQRYLDRSDLEYEAAAIVSAYQSSHPGGVRIYFDDAVLRVYRLEM